MNMAATNLKTLLIGLAMLAATGLALALTPTKRLADTYSELQLESIIPSKFGDWEVDPTEIPVSVSGDAREMLEETYDHILNRAYFNDKGDQFMLSIAYGSRQTQKLKAHRQEVCYAAQGFEVSDLHVEDVMVGGNKITVTRMYAVNKGRREPVTYWFTVGDEVVQSRAERLLVQLKYAFSGVVPDGVLVRVSNISGNKQSSYVEHIKFINELLSHVPVEQRRRLVGSV